MLSRRGAKIRAYLRLIYLGLRVGAMGVGTNYLVSRRLPIPSREEIINSPIREDGATSSFTFPPSATESRGSPVMDDPSQDLDRELMQKAAGAMP